MAEGKQLDWIGHELFGWKGWFDFENINDHIILKIQVFKTCLCEMLFEVILSKFCLVMPIFSGHYTVSDRSTWNKIRGSLKGICNSDYV